MIPLRVCLEGFMSYQQRQELRFDGAALCLLAGNNGAGKSTVFDAITYALYGKARGSQKERGQHHLINIRSDRLLVELDFEVEGRAYRIRRTLTLMNSRKVKAREDRDVQSTVQALELQARPDQDLSAWQEVIIKDTDSATGFASWRQRVLGLDYDAFTASVMLLQGESEKLLQATPAGRYSILAALIDLSRFQELHRQVDEQRKEWGVKQTTAEQRLRAMPQIEEAQLEEARAAQGAAEQRGAEAEARKDVLATLMVHAGRWVELQREREGLVLARERDAAVLARREEITVAHERWDDLQRALVLLQQVVEQRGRARALREQARALEAEIAAARGPLEAAQAAQRAAQEVLSTLEAAVLALQEERDAGKDAVARLEQRGEQLRALTALRQQLRQALERQRAAAQRGQALAEALTERQQQHVAALAAQGAAAREERLRWDHAQAALRALREGQARQARFAAVEGAAACEHCGQAIHGEYAAQRRHAMDQEVAAATQHQQEARDAHRGALEQSRLAGQALEAALAALQAAGEAHQASEKEQGQHAAQAAILREQSLQLRQEPTQTAALQERPDDDEANALSTAAAHLASELHALQREQERRAAQVAARQAELQEGRHAYNQRALALQKSEREQARRADKLEMVPDALRDSERVSESLRGPLAASWRARSLDLDEAGLQRLQQEERDLRRYQQDFIALQRAERGGHEEVLRRLDHELAQLPQQARRAPAELQAEHEANQDALRQHQQASQDLRQQLRALEEQRAARREAEAQRLQVALQHDLHKLVADELGPAGLQLRLVQQAERGIVDEANQLLHSMSRGALRLKLNKEDEGSGKALDLLLYNEETSEQPMPISLASGSQRFRVAIGLALAIGRYMASGARRIESVIIDEGFGCLDERGRDDMVNVLKELKAHLRRIILVSHQREFIDSFEHGYRITVRDHASTVQPLWES